MGHGGSSFRGGVHMDLCGIVGVGVRMADDDVMIL